MNYLAHMLLAGKDPEIRVGNFIADGVKGKVMNTYSHGIQNGIRHHRDIDVFTDNHPLFRETVALLRPDLGRYSAVAADMFYDHLLAKQWYDYSSQNRLAFTHGVYADLQTAYELFPETSKSTFQYMTYRNWLYNYSDLKFLERCFHGLGHRAEFSNNFQNAIISFKSNYIIIKMHFKDFMPQIISELAR